MLGKTVNSYFKEKHLGTVVHVYNPSTLSVEWRQKGQEFKTSLGHTVQDQPGLCESLSEKERKKIIRVF